MIYKKISKKFYFRITVYSRIPAFLKKSEIFFKKRLTNEKRSDIINIVVRDKTAKQNRKNGDLWGFSSAGRASALQAEGHRFEPCSPHHMAS